MPLKVTKKVNPKAPEYTRTYLKLIALEFDVREMLGNRVKQIMTKQQTESQQIEGAKNYYRQIYKSLCIDLTRREWEVEGETVSVQTCELYREPEYVIRVQFDAYTTLVYSKESFKVTDSEQISELEKAIEKF